MNPRVVPPKDDHWLFDQTDQRVASVGQSDPIADSGAVELLAFLQRTKQRLPGIGTVGDFRNFADQFSEHFIAVASREVQFNRDGGNQVAYEHPT
jgi:hypothetical protein